MIEVTIYLQNSQYKVDKIQVIDRPPYIDFSFITGSLHLSGSRFFFSLPF